MRALLNRLAHFILAIGLVAGTAEASAFTLQLTPANGQVGGPAGSVVGWGYSISNDTSSYLVPTALNADLFSHQWGSQISANFHWQQISTTTIPLPAANTLATPAKP